ncbi:hypothetical protein MHH56_23770 [Paenibacillus sp. FSL K6-3182]|uniref:hypothetical protein n=1 Tax=Paenibacillus sp. FSL K6-3182 TaxID=2921495 RepID=UPI0030D5B9CB
MNQKKEGWLLALFGLGSITGTGSGFISAWSSLVIEKKRFSVISNFFLASVGTFLSFSSLNENVCRTLGEGIIPYVFQASSSMVGYIGLSEMHILGSQLTDIGIFAKFSS